MSFPVVSDRFILRRIAEHAPRLKADSYGVALVNQFGANAGRLEVFEFPNRSTDSFVSGLLEKIKINAPKGDSIILWPDYLPSVCVCFLEQIYDRRIGFIWYSISEPSKFEIEAEIKKLGREIEIYMQNRKRLAIYTAISDASARIGVSENPMADLGSFIKNTLFPDHIIVWERDREYQTRLDGYKAIYTSDKSDVRILPSKGIVGYCFDDPLAFGTEKAIRVDDFFDAEAIHRRFGRTLANVELLESRGLHSGIFIPIMFEGRVDAVVAVMFRRPFGATNIEQEVLFVIVELFKGVLRHRVDRRFINRLRVTYKRVAPRINRTIIVAESIHQMKDDIIALRNVFSVLSAQTTKEKEILERGRKVSRQLAELTSSLKDSIGQEDDKKTIRLKTRKFALLSLVNASVEKYGETIRNHAINSKINISPDLFLTAPYSLIERIIENGITNSIKALSIATHRTRRLSINAVPKSEMLEIIISDTGPGVEQGILEYVFEPFFTTNDQDSSGLGLFLVNSAVTDLGGAARAESEWGRGFNLIIELPNSIVQHVQGP